MDSRTRQSKAFKQWYEKNKEQFNEKRRKKYADNEELKQKYIERQRAYRKLHPRPSRSMSTELFKASDLYDLTGRTSDWVRLCELKGWVPATARDTRHRRYTKMQLQLLVMLSNACTERNQEVLLEKLSVLVPEIHENWGS